MRTREQVKMREDWGEWGEAERGEEQRKREERKEERRVEYIGLKNGVPFHSIFHFDEKEKRCGEKWRDEIKSEKRGERKREIGEELRVEK